MRARLTSAAEPCRRTVALLALGVTLAAAACSPAAAPREDGAGGTGAGGGMGGSDGGTGGGPAPNEAPWAVTFGMGQGEGSPFWFAYYRTYFQSDPNARCHAASIGETCRVYDCRPLSEGEDDISGPSAGPVTISVWLGDDVTLEPDASGLAFAEGDGPKWWPGDPVRMSAPGAALPAFDLGFTFPEEAQLIEPDVVHSADAEIAIDTSRPFPLRWLPTNESVDVELWQGDLGSGIATLVLACYFPGADGQAELPLEGLARFDSGPTAPTTHLGVAHLQLRERLLGGRPLIAGAMSWVARSVVLE